MLRSGKTGQLMAAGDYSHRSIVKFGSVIVSGAEPSPDSVRVNVERSTQALARVTKKLANPGIALREKKNVPQFSVAEGEIGIFVRRLNGRTDRGRFIDGRFQVIE
ncbi:MAG: hypothetical protein QE484_13760 [Rhizobium sp.]|nr:hypothetical protein [Rhizobium sp.]